jgi:hypothetical protein
MEYEQWGFIEVELQFADDVPTKEKFSNVTDLAAKAWIVL